MVEQPVFEQMQNAVERLKRAGALGRSPAYVKLLDYLAETTITASPCSELSIAFEVFDKDESFDVASDSTVRVYIYNLRRKLDVYYSGPGRIDEIKLIIPKGEYRLLVERNKPVSKLLDLKENWGQNIHSIGLAVVGLVIGAILTFLLMIDADSKYQFSDEQLAFWGNILTDDRPVVVVVGDYYIFGETSDSGETRLVREFDINSEGDLRDKLKAQTKGVGAGSIDEHFDLALTYLPRGSVYALASVQKILQLAEKAPRITMMSEFSAEDLRANHVIYLGYISGLGVLERYTFSASRFDIGYSYDDLADAVTGEHYSSDFIAAENDRNFVDYGLIASFSVAENNQVVILTGTRDAGLMEMSELAITSDVLRRMELSVNENSAFLSVFKVNGFNLTNISGELINSEYLDVDRISGQ